jgi:hypothetical protein
MFSKWFLSKVRKWRAYPVFCEVRKVKREREDEMKRLMKQMEIGDPIFDMLQEAWNLIGKPANWRVDRNSNCDGAYQIKVIFVNTFGPAVRMVTITVDLKQPKNRQIFVNGEVSPILRIDGGLPIVEGERWIRNFLVPKIFLPSRA